MAGMGLVALVIGCRQPSAVGQPSSPMDSADSVDSAQDSDPPTVDLFVSSRGTDSVLRFDGETGAPRGTFVAPGDGGLSVTQEVRFTSGGDLLVTGRYTSDILRFDGEDGEFLGPFSSGLALREPTKLDRGPDGHWYVSQWAGDRQVVRFDGETGAYLGPATDVAPTLGCGHAWDAVGDLYVADYGAGVVLRYASGALVGPVASAPLVGPVNVWFDADGTLLVADWERGAIERFDPSTGTHLGTLVDGLLNIEGVAIGPDGRLYVADWSADRIERFEADGTPLGTFASAPRLEEPNSLVFGP